MTPTRYRLCDGVIAVEWPGAVQARLGECSCGGEAGSGGGGGGGGGGEGGSRVWGCEHAVPSVYAITRGDPRLCGLPTQQYRPGQWDAIKQIVAAFVAGTRHVLLDAPPGSGKTFIAESVRSILDCTAVYLCSTKNLQTQVAQDFPKARVLMGRANYRPLPDSPYTCDDCYALKRYLCAGRCPYAGDREKYLAAPLQILNYPFALREWGGSAPIRPPLTIFDEADTLESAILAASEIIISASVANLLATRTPDRLAWAWEDGAPAVQNRLKSAEIRFCISPTIADKVDAAREIRRLKLLAKKLEQVNDTWGFETVGTSAVFRPISVASIAADYVWRHIEKALLMSATFISHDYYQRTVGIPNAITVKLRDSFPVGRRPVIIRPVAKVTQKSGPAAILAIKAGLTEILHQHPRDRILVHSVSHRLAKEAAPASPRVLHTGPDRAAAVARFRTTGAAVLIAPAMDRGLDLPYELCPVIVIIKVPYPSLGDARVQAILKTHDGQVWYDIQTVRSLVQMTGRGMRANDDYCLTYVLDDEFTRFWRRARHLLPAWWQAAVQFHAPLTRVHNRGIMDGVTSPSSLKGSSQP